MTAFVDRAPVGGMACRTPILPSMSRGCLAPPKPISLPLSPRTRRPREQLDRKFLCPMPGCCRRYALPNSLHQHLKKAHEVYFPPGSRGRPKGGRKDSAGSCGSPCEPSTPVLDVKFFELEGLNSNCASPIISDSSDNVSCWSPNSIASDTTFTYNSATSSPTSPAITLDDLDFSLPNFDVDPTADTAATTDLSFPVLDPLSLPTIIPFEPVVDTETAPSALQLPELTQEQIEKLAGELRALCAQNPVCFVG
eukprot:comp20569_c1_seq1/m.26459 comp20569_c1_seq1/g.26459  ORF comp20569_c1_seq1/g.26459 comp20569_c1_seq1/m.26459 type:complete len:252 (-) comp20569_c1_seq1:518-1273(-)